jgi:hypothetical protein
MIDLIQKPEAKNFGLFYFQLRRDFKPAALPG